MGKAIILYFFVLYSLSYQTQGKENAHDRILRINSKMSQSSAKRQIRRGTVVSNEPGANSITEAKLFEGDILLTDIQKSTIVGRKRASSSRSRALPGPWTEKIIPFAISPRLRYLRNKIYMVLLSISRKTCLLFREIKFTWMKNFIYFQRKPGCWAGVGKINTKHYQTISVGRGCENEGILRHLVAHVLGLWHTQSRQDRNSHIRVRYSNIQDGKARHFTSYKHSQTDKTNLPYDYNSLMHFGGKAFSKNGRDTLEKLQRTSNTGMGNTALSDDDVLKLNVIYNCSIRPSEKRGFGKWTSWSECNVARCSQQRRRFCFNAPDAYTKRRICPGADKLGIHAEERKCDSTKCGSSTFLWSSWSTYSACSVSCGRGVQVRKRICRNARSRRTSNVCPGTSTETKSCYSRPCQLGAMSTNFDKNDFGMWNNDQKDDMNWMIRNGRTPSDGTGPIADHTTGKGNYVYIESSGKREGSKANLISKDLPAGRDMCLRFFYSMRGRASGSLRVFVHPKTGSPFKVFEKSGEQGKNGGWLEAIVPIRDPRTESKIIIQAEIGYLGPNNRDVGKSDIAIDDVSLNMGKCGSISSRITANKRCPSDAPRVNCKVDPCLLARCPAFPSARCVKSNCGACRPKFLFRGMEIVDCYRKKCGPLVPTAACQDNPCKRARCPAYPSAQCVPSFCGVCSATFYVYGRLVRNCYRKVTNITHAPKPTNRTTVEQRGGIWGLWGEWSNCSVSCGNGERNRSRICKYEAENGRYVCAGNNTEIEKCTLEPCKGSKNTSGWGNWESWSACSRSCGVGRRVRYRRCAHGTDSKLCKGNGREVEACNMRPCRQGRTMDGNWGRWSKWSACSTSCGMGKRSRTRACDSPYPQRGGKTCPGPKSMTATCLNKMCGIDTNFENGYGKLQNTYLGDQFNWNLQRGTSRISKGMPRGDHTNGRGTFAYIEAYGRNNGDKARLMGPVMPSTSASCLSFYYSMSGSSVGHLGLLVRYFGINKGPEYIFYKLPVKQSSPRWKLGQATVSAGSTYQFVFEGSFGNIRDRYQRHESVIGLDDIRFQTGRCPQGNVIEIQSPTKFPPDCLDRDPNCPKMARSGQCILKKAEMAYKCKKSCVCQRDLCKDVNPRCVTWARRGECKANPKYMMIGCCKACVELQTNCVDEERSCKDWARKGECRRNPRYMLVFCRKSCKGC